MLSKIFGTALFGIAACLITITAVYWWKWFGVREPYPYIATFMSIIMWYVTYLTATEKED